MTDSLILITGATGATGGYAIDQLLSKGAKIRALVHKDDDRASKLRARGVQTVVGDLEDFASVRAALDGVNTAYFVYPLEPNILKAATYFAQAAKEAGVSGIVNISQRTAHQHSASHSAQDHWFSEQIFNWSGVPTIHIRPTLFMEWLLYPFQLPVITGHGALMLPAGDGRHAPISAFDQGRVIAALLLDPTPHIGKTYNLYGPQEMTHAEIAKAVGDAIGKEVKYVPETLDAFETRMTQVGAPEYVVKHLVAVFAEYQQNLLDGINDTVEVLTGTPPMSITQFARENIALLKPSSN